MKRHALPLGFSRIVPLLTLLVIGLAGCKQEAPKPGQEAFDAANARITVLEAKPGFGNTAQAERVAALFAVEVANREADAFEGGKDANKSLTTKGTWLTYCQDHGDAVVFLVHVPNLDTYEGEDRQALAALAWETAAELSEPLRSAGSKKVVVALRGNLLFGAIAEGTVGGKPAIQVGAAVATDVLFPHFVAAS